MRSRTSSKSMRTIGSALKPTQTFRRLLTVAVAASALLRVSACTKGEEAHPGEATDAAPPSAVTAGLSTPESVLWDSASSTWYVSNINGQPLEKDDNGYILRLAADGSARDSVPFINGADDDITLNAPKGLALVGDTLWVADIDVVRAFDMNTGTEVASVDLAPMDAQFLNDVAVGTDGTLYITDSGIAFDAAGNATHPGQSRVFSIRGRAPEVAVRLRDESAPNGITWDESRAAFVIVGFNTPEIYSWAPGAAEVTVIGRGAGGADGVVALADGRIIYTSWADSSLNVFDDTTSTTITKGLNAPADLGFDAARRLVAVPLFTDNRVEFRQVPAPR